MKKFGIKGKIMEENFKAHIDVICKKLNHWYETIKSKNEEKTKEKALAVCSKGFKGRCHKCRKTGHK